MIKSARDIVKKMSFYANVMTHIMNTGEEAPSSASGPPIQIGKGKQDGCQR